MTREELIFELKKRCSFWLNNKTISKKHALECLCGILEKEEFQSSLPSNLDEAAEEFGKRQGVELAPFAKKLFKAGAEWMAGQGKQAHLKPEMLGKAESLKDLPKWDSNPKSSMIDEAYVIGQWLYYKEHRIRISDLEKLPGFKED